MPDKQTPRYRFRGSIKPSADVKRPVKAYFNAADGSVAGGNGAKPTTATIDIFDVIDSWGGWWGISAGEVDQALAALGDGVETLYVRVNSPGGESTEGMAIANLLRAHAATVHVTTYGLAASAASHIAIAGDSLSMAPGSMLMIHKAWNYASGNADEMREVAATLDKFDLAQVGSYVMKAGSDTDWLALMAAETWLTAQEAVDLGLADQVGIQTGPPPVNPDDQAEPMPDCDGDTPFERAASVFDLSVFTRAQAVLAAKTPTATAAAGSQKGAGMDPAKLREALDLPVDASDIEVQAALATAGVIDKAGEPPTTTPPTTTPATEPAATPTPTAAAADTVTIPKAGYDELVANAQAGATAAQRLREQERDAFLDSVRAKFLPANRATWAAEYDKNPEATREWFKTAPDVVPLTALGKDTAPDVADLVMTDDEATELAGLARTTKEALLS